MRDSVMIYRNQVEALRGLAPEQFKAAVLAICDYELDNVVPEGDAIAVAMWQMSKPLIDRRNRNYENGKKGGRNPNVTETEPTHNPNVTETEPTDNLKDKGKRINTKEIPSKEGTKKSGFTPPTLQEVQEYVSEKGYKIDPERFIDFYQSKGWYVGKNKMKDWKSAVRNWSRSQREEKTAEGRQGKTVNRFNDFKQREYDYAELERQLLGR